MKYDNPLDKALELWGPTTAQRAAITDVSGTLEYAWAAAQAVFEEHARPEHAVEIAKLILGRLDSAGKTQSADDDPAD